MGQFVLNARRWPRAPLHCRVLVFDREAQWYAQTQDLGPGGCQLVSPRLVATGSQLRLAIATSALPEKLSVAGRVAWMNEIIPVRLGVAFTDQQASSDPRNWFVRLLQANPAMAAAARRIPQRLSAESLLFLGEPPRFVIDFTLSELSVLRLIGCGTRVADVMAHHVLQPEEATRAIFSLLARHAITLSRESAVAPLRWLKTLSQAEAALAAEPPQATPEPAAPPRPLYPTRPVATAAGLPVAGSPRSRLDARVEWADRRPPASSAPPPISLRAREGQRRPEAEALFREAQRQLAASDISAAIALLRRALALSPRDEEISALLGELAFRNRQVE